MQLASIPILAWFAVWVTASIFDLQILKDPTVCEIAEKYKKSPAQILLRWAVQQNICTYLQW